MMKVIAVALTVGLLMGVGVGCGKVAAPTREPVSQQAPDAGAKVEASQAPVETPAETAVEEAAQETVGAEAEPAEDIAALCQERCSKCHAFAKVEKYEGAVAWQDTVKRMVEERGAKVAPEEVVKIVAFLDETYPRK
ncbi:MAG TPA: hypothetical protein PLO37_03215 [Candidatus Hydrogenedentes bacterium]|nr:hypothetical protein [Candidatus Hydrogenedentota bacterium]HPG65829.1 hypothetical protein [Candidatus Hydrogenedentota bacterium]